MSKSIIGYARVGASQDEELASALAQQTSHLYQAGATEIFSEVASSTSAHRHQLERVLELVRTRQIDEVVVTRINRLSRSIVQLNQLIEIFIESGVNLRILDQHLDLMTPTGLLMVNLLGGLVKWELSLP